MLKLNINYEKYGFPLITILLALLRGYERYNYFKLEREHGIINNNEIIHFLPAFTGVLCGVISILMIKLCKLDMEKDWSWYLLSLAVSALTFYLEFDVFLYLPVICSKIGFTISMILPMIFLGFAVKNIIKTFVLWIINPGTHIWIFIIVFTSL